MPLFLHKEDLDVAVQSAYRQRNAQQIRTYRERADKQQAEYDSLEGQMSAASGGLRSFAWLCAPA